MRLPSLNVPVRPSSPPYESNDATFCRCSHDDYPNKQSGVAGASAVSGTHTVTASMMSVPCM